MQRQRKWLAAALMLMPLFVLCSCSRGQKIYTAGLEPETADVRAGVDGTDTWDSGTGVPDGGGSNTQDGAAGTIPENIDTGTDGQMLSADEEDSGQTEAAGYVYVCGAVQNPGVYPISPGMRMFEVLALAGGFTDAADQDWLNLAGVAQDGQQLYVYTEEETQQLRMAGQYTETQSGRYSLASQGTENSKINLNTASKEELMTLPGIGEAKADAVIAYREQQGFFRSIEEIQNISGIKSAVFSKIKDLITV